MHQYRRTCDNHRHAAKRHIPRTDGDNIPDCSNNRFLYLDEVRAAARHRLPSDCLAVAYLRAYRHMPKKISHGHNIIQQRISELGPMSKGERWTLMVFVLTAVAWIMRSEKDIGGLIIPPGINTYMPWCMIPPLQSQGGLFCSSCCRLTGKRASIR